MTNIVGIPSTRVSEMFIRERLLQQIQYVQRELFRVQTQLSTGYQFQLPGESPIAAMRILSLQRLLERKEQVQTNLSTNQSYLSTSDVALSQISGAVAEARGVALEMVGTIPTEQQRATAVLQIRGITEQLLDAGNQQFRGRYLFAGSTTRVRPFVQLDNGVIEYRGNEIDLRSYADIDLLFETNVNGADVFGAVSEVVRGTADLNPTLSYETRLSDLRGGEGITPGSIMISDGNPANTSIVDLSSAETIGDVATLIRNNAPGGRQIHVEITPNSLVIQLESDPTVNLSIREVGEGTTAHELGIFTEVGVGNNPVYGEDLQPVVRLGTALTDVIGARARAAIWLDGSDNDIILEADTAGDAYNDVTIRFVDDPAVTVGNEVVLYDPVAKTIEVRIDENHTQAHDVVTAINNAHDLGVLPFTARIDPLDDQLGGAGLVPATPPGDVAGTTAWGSGTELDQDSGLQIRNGPDTYVIDISSAETIEDLLNSLNGSAAGVVASINEDATGIDVRSRRSGADFAIGENGGLTATQLGLRTFTRDTRLEDLNFGLGVDDYDGGGNRAEALLDFNGSDNDVIFRARNTGAEWNDFVVELVDSGGPPGSESVVYDPAGKRITVNIVPGSTTAADVVDLASTTPGLADDFEISIAPTEPAESRGTGLVSVKTETTSGGYAAGAEFRITRADGVMFEVDIAGATTIGDVIDSINNHPDNLASGVPLVAQLSEYGNGIELIDNSQGGGTLTVTRNDGCLAAIQLGLVEDDQTDNQATDPGGYAEAVVPSAGANNDLVFRSLQTGTADNGVQVIFQDTGMGPGSEYFTYDPVAETLTFGIVPGSTTANDIIALFQADPLAPSRFSVELQPTDEGAPNSGTGPVQVLTAALSGGQPQRLTGRDVHLQETQGLFTALLRLQQGLQDNDMATVQRAVDLIDEYMLQMNFVRAELGARQQALDILKARLDEEHVQLREILANEHEADMTEVVSNLAAKQVALEAAIKASAEIFSLTLLDYL